MPERSAGVTSHGLPLLVIQTLWTKGLPLPPRSGGCQPSS